MTPSNFLSQLRNLIVGGTAFIRDVTLSPTMLAVSGATRATTASIDRVILDANNESVIINFRVPRDYDSQSDKFRIKLFVVYVSGTSVTLDLDVVTVTVPGAAIPSAASVTSTAVVITAATQNGDVTFDLDGQLDLQPGRLVSIEIDAQVAGSGIAHVLGAAIAYGSNLVATDTDSR